jgi:hypothetical protein
MRLADLPFRVVTAEEEDAYVRGCLMEGFSIGQTTRLMKIGHWRVRAIAKGMHANAECGIQNARFQMTSGPPRFSGFGTNDSQDSVSPRDNSATFDRGGDDGITSLGRMDARHGSGGGASECPIGDNLVSRITLLPDIR